MNITVAICTWNRCELLQQTLQQMTKLQPPDAVTWELIVVNNNCTDDTDHVISAFSNRLPIRGVYETASGQSHARNRAVREAKGDYIIWTDDDVLVCDSWLTTYGRAFAQDPDAAVFGGPIEPWFVGRTPRWLRENWTVVGGAYALRELGDKVVALSDKLTPYGANFAVRTDVQKQFLYDPNLGLKPNLSVRGEETSVIRAMLAAGLHGWWVPKASVRHYIPPDRQTISYLRSFFFGLGIATVNTDPPDEPSSGVPTLLGKPRWLLRRAIQYETGFRLRRFLARPEVWLDDLKQSSLAWGRLSTYKKDASARHFLPWRLTHLGGPLNTMLLVNWRRWSLPRKLRAITAGLPESITIVMAVRNRADYRLRNALNSIQNQDYPQELIHVTIVDYDSDAEHADRLRAICQEFGAQRLRIENRRVWNKSHCLNTGIKQAQSKYLMTSDVDIIFARNYIREAIAVLQEDPLAAVYSQCQDLPESTQDQLQACADRGEPLDVNRLLHLASPRTAGDCHTGINASYTYFYHLVRGYDQFYEGWGSEDNDLAKRFRYLGLKMVSLNPRAVYLHQWHPKHQGVQAPGYERAIETNEQYFQSNHSIYRNKDGWGEIDD